MTLDEAIKRAKKIAEEQEKAAKEWHENQVRKCELIRFAEMDYTHENECKKCADEHRQLTEWLKDYKRLLEQQPCEDCVSREAVLDNAYAYGNGLEPEGYCVNVEDIQALPPATPTFSNDATNYDVLKAVFGNTSAFRIKDTMEFEKGFESWFSKPYKRGDSDGSN